MLVSARRSYPYRYGYYWPNITADCFQFAKGCKACQLHEPIQRVLVELGHLVKSRPFRVQAMNLIGKIHFPSAKKHSFVLVAIDYFIKWVEAQPIKSIGLEDIICLILHQIMYRLGILKTITTD